MEAFAPAPASTETVAPSAMYFFTVSGDAETRVSPAAVSFSTAIFTTSAGAAGDDEHDQRRHNDGSNSAPFEQRDKS